MMAIYSEELDSIQSWKDLKAYLDKYGIGNALKADPNTHREIMMTDRGAVLTRGAELNLYTEASLDDLKVGVGKKKKQVVLVHVVLAEASAATVRRQRSNASDWPDDIKVLMPKKDAMVPAAVSDKGHVIPRPKPSSEYYGDYHPFFPAQRRAKGKWKEPNNPPRDATVRILAWDEDDIRDLDLKVVREHYEQLDRSKGPPALLQQPDQPCKETLVYPLDSWDVAEGCQQAVATGSGVRRPRAKKSRKAKVTGKARLEEGRAAVGSMISGGICKAVQPTPQQRIITVCQHSHSRLACAPLVRGTALNTLTNQGLTAALRNVSGSLKPPGLLPSGCPPQMLQAMYNTGTGHGNGQAPDGMSHGSYAPPPQPSPHPDVLSLYQSQPCQGQILLNDHLDNEHPPGWGYSAPGVYMTPPYQPTMHPGTSSPSFGVTGGLPLGSPTPPGQQDIPADGRLGQCSLGHLQHMRGKASNCFSLASGPEMPLLLDLDKYMSEVLKELPSSDSPDLLAMPGSCPGHSGGCPLPAHTSMAVPGMMPGYASSPDVPAGMDLAECLQLKAFIQEKGPGLDIPDFRLVDNAVPMDIVPPGGADSLANWAPQPGSPYQPDLPRQCLRVDGIVPPHPPCLALGAAPGNASGHLGPEISLQDLLTSDSDQEFDLPDLVDTRDNRADCNLFWDGLLADLTAGTT